MKNPSIRDPEFLDRDTLCHDCRRCLPLCPSFPSLFNSVDRHQQEASRLGKTEIREVIDLCYQCKLCYNHCPYHPPHEWMIDFPKLMSRSKIVQANEEGIPFFERFGNDQDRMGRLGCRMSGLANWLLQDDLARQAMEKFTGIDRRWIMPSYESQPFSKWLSRHRTVDGENGRVMLFATCFVEYSNAATARAAVQVLEHSEIAVENGYVGCCGAPNLHGGDLEGARAKAEGIVQKLVGRVRDGIPVVVPGPTCSYQLKHELPELIRSEDARLVAQKVFDIGEYLWKLRADGKLNGEFPKRLGRVAYHLPCHLKSQNIGFRSLQLMRLAGADVEMFEACSGVDGTWGMKARWYDRSVRVAHKLLDGIRTAEPAYVATDCPLAGLRILEGTGRRALHPVELLREAYGLVDPR
jgi:Fe-S oxidoreductase